jgi:hypothetical protein
VVALPWGTRCTVSSFNEPGVPGGTGGESGELKGGRSASPLPGLEWKTLKEG